MSTITRTRMYRPMAGMILTAALVLPAAAQQQVPFKGTFQGVDTPAPSMLTQSITGTGTHVGLFSAITFLKLTASGGTGTAQWIAANGDTINTSVVGSPKHVLMAPCQVVGAQPRPSVAQLDDRHGAERERE